MEAAVGVGVGFVLGIVVCLVWAACVVAGRADDAQEALEAQWALTQEEHS